MFARFRCATHAQGSGSLINLDRLQIISLGASVGRILPSQIEPANVYATQAEYGPIGQKWHFSVSVSYWESRYRDEVVRTFVDSLEQEPHRHVRAHPSRRGSTCSTSRSAATRATRHVSSSFLKPFAGVGVAAHVVNAEGKLIKGTFVERTLDDIAFGVYGVTGLGVRISRSIGVEGLVRGDLVGGLRSVQARAGATYYFGRIRGM